MRSLDYTSTSSVSSSGSVRLNDFEKQNHSLTGLKEWQDGFEGTEHISGTPGEVGAQTKMFYTNGKRKIVLTETILVNNLPNEFSGKYEAKETVNTMKNTFHIISENKTRWTAEVEYTEFRGFMPKLMAKLMPGMFKKQVQKGLNQFKSFAENQS